MSIDLEGEYHCSAEWHLAKIAKFASVIYPFALRLSNKTQRFYCSQEKLAAHFRVSRATVQRAMRDLASLGFFERIHGEPFSPTMYRVITHDDWKAANPGQCVVKQEMPWSAEEGDPLGIRLHSASGGKIFYKPYQLTALRNTGLTDNELVVYFEAFVGNECSRRSDGAWHGRWKSVPLRFLKWLKDELPEAELEKFGLRPFEEVQRDVMASCSGERSSESVANLPC